jgi:hypothetical protein
MLIVCVVLALIHCSTAEGWYFDGKNYIDADGNSTRWHPLLDTWAQKYLAEHNAEADAKRAEVAAISARYATEEQAVL